MASTREEREAAGAWLKQARQNAGYETQGAFAAALGVNPSMITRYELGQSAIEDERAEQIARVLDRPLLEVRRNLGLWVPTAVAEANDEADAALARRLRYEISELREDLKVLKDMPDVSRGTRKLITRALQQEIERLEERLAELPPVSHVRPDSVVETKPPSLATNGD